MRDLRGRDPVKPELSVAAKVIGALWIAFALGALGLYAWTVWPKSPPPSVVSDSRLPSS